jgi:predicted RNA-binding Zn-ribbon protein involved in translation (DUF1610 family)
MSEKKPTPWMPQSRGKACPICGKPTYSTGGIHPQCAVRQADEPRTEKLKADRKRAATAAGAASAVAVTKPSAWTKKKCPKCGGESHVRQKSCDCGHVFV